MSTQANLRDQVKQMEKDIGKIYDIWEEAKTRVDSLGEVTLTEKEFIEISLILGV